MKRIIYTKDAPYPIGPYSQAVLINNTLYTSGQIAVNPISDELIIDTIKKETTQVMENLKAVLASVDMVFDNVVKSTIYLTNMDDFVEINVIYGSYFENSMPPARETVQVGKLPKNANVEISVIAIK